MPFLICGAETPRQDRSFHAQIASDFECVKSPFSTTTKKHMKRGSAQMGWLVKLTEKLFFGASPNDKNDVEILFEETGVTQVLDLGEYATWALKRSTISVLSFPVPSDLNACNEKKQIEWYKSAAERAIQMLEDGAIVYIYHRTGHGAEATVAFLAWALLDRANCTRSLNTWLEENHHALVLDNEDARRMTQRAMDQILSTNGRNLKSFLKKNKTH